MKFNELTIEKKIEPIIEKKYFYSLIGYKKGSTKLSKKEKIICEEVFELGKRIMEPRGIYIIREIKRISPSGVELKQTELLLEGNSMKSLLKNSFAVILFVVTIGKRIDDKIKSFINEGDNSKAIILDAFGSSAVEGTADSLNNKFEIMARQNRYQLTRRFSPGYGDLPLNFQKKLMKELDFKRIGIELTPQNLMIPQKSITAVIGIEK